MKAGLAQILLVSAWEKTLDSKHPNKPWPWADTRPIARLTVPSHNIDQIVLEGDQGNSLAFGPGLHPASDIDLNHENKPGLILISGHRDTHFNYLKDVKLGEVIELQTTRTSITRYRVESIQVFNAKQEIIRTPDHHKWLTLVTCYPFESIFSDPSLRYVVMAKDVIE